MSTYSHDSVVFFKSEKKMQMFDILPDHTIHMQWYFQIILILKFKMEKFVSEYTTRKSIEVFPIQETKRKKLNVFIQEEVLKCGWRLSAAFFYLNPMSKDFTLLKKLHLPHSAFTHRFIPTGELT
jgi:hypothetical protein